MLKASHHPPSFFRGVRLRLTIAVPAIITLLTFGSGILAVNLSKLRIFDPFGKLRTPPFHLNQIYLWVAGYALISGLIGFIFAYYILTRPVRKSLETIEAFLPESPSLPYGAETETILLAQTLTSLYPTLGKLKMVQSLLDAFQGGILWISRNRTIVFGNKKGFAILGYSPSQQPPPHSLPSLESLLNGFKDATPFLSIIEEGLNNSRYFSSKVIQLTPKEGNPFKMGVSSSPVAFGNQYEGILLSFRELSEFQRLQRDLDHLNRLSTIGRLASGLVHEIRNPLGSIMGLLEILKGEISQEDAEIQVIVDRIYQASTRIQNLLAEVLDFAGPADVTLKPVALPLLLDQAVDETLASLQEKPFRLIKDYPLGETEPKIEADESKLKQAFVNILRNAMEAVDKSGEVKVRARPYNKGLWRVEISNSGSYIAEDDGERIFDPFFTTKPRGTGLGLPIAREFITLQGGTLSFKSDPEDGVTFIIQF